MGMEGDISKGYGERFVVEGERTVGGVAMSVSLFIPIPFAAPQVR
jgi:hypothetical protein